MVKSKSFSFSKNFREESLVAFSTSLEKKYGKAAYSQILLRKAKLFKVSDIKAAARLVHPERQFSDGHGLSRSFVDRLTRTVSRKQISACFDKVSLKFTFSLDGDYPAIGFETWQTSSLILPSGFLEIESHSVEMIEDVRKRFRRWLLKKR